VITTISPVPALLPEGRGWGARSLSLGLHVGAVALALWYTHAPRGPVAPDRDPGVVLTWATQSALRRPPALPPTAAPLPSSAVGRVPVPVPALPVIAVQPPALATAIAAEPFPGSPPAPPAYAPYGPPSPASASPMDVRLVEEPPLLLSHPAPGYPELLRRAGIEGRVTMEAVIDTAGRAEPGSLRVVASTHALFERDAAALVLRSRYRPARFGGQSVRVRIRVPVIFALRR